MNIFLEYHIPCRDPKLGVIELNEYCTIMTLLELSLGLSKTIFLQIKKFAVKATTM